MGTTEGYDDILNGGYTGSWTNKPLHDKLEELLIYTFTLHLSLNAFIIREF